MALSTLPPIYPLPSLARALTRMAYLEKHLRAADRLLARRYSEVIEETRVRLGFEFDALYAAVCLLTEELPTLPRCAACGKISHRGWSSARRHLALFDVINKHPGQMRVYRCKSGGDGLHVGHVHKRTRAGAADAA